MRFRDHNDVERALVALHDVADELNVKEPFNDENAPYGDTTRRTTIENSFPVLLAEQEIREKALAEAKNRTDDDEQNQAAAATNEERTEEEMEEVGDDGSKKHRFESKLLFLKNKALVLDKIRKHEPQFIPMHLR